MDTKAVKINWIRLSKKVICLRIVLAFFLPWLFSLVKIYIPTHPLETYEPIYLAFIIAQPFINIYALWCFVSIFQKRFILRASMSLVYCALLHIPLVTATVYLVLLIDNVPIKLVGVGDILEFAHFLIISPLGPLLLGFWLKKLCIKSYQLLCGLQKEVITLPEQPDMTEKRDVSTVKTVMGFLKSAKTKIFAIKLPLIVASFIVNKAYTFITALEKIFKAAKQAGRKKTLSIIAAMLGFFLALYMSFWFVFITMFAPYGHPFEPWLLFRIFVAEVLLTFLAMPAVRILPLKWLKRMSPVQTFIISFLIVIYPVYGLALFLAGLAILV
jgi:hypothetical protein